MTTPERLRRRQRIEGSLLLLLGMFTILISIYFRAQDANQERCINDYFAATSETYQIRSELVERESRATRDLLLDGTSAKSRAEFARVRDKYATAIEKVDEARAKNPVQPFPKGCE